MAKIYKGGVWMEEAEKFLSELAELTKKHKIKISGCGCCGSPSLVKFGDMSGDIVTDLSWDEDKEKYDYCE